MNDRVRQAAQTALNQGQPAKALQLYQELTASGQALADDWFNQAWLLRRAGRPADALTSYEKAQALGVDAPADVYLNMASILSQELHQPAEAKAALAKVLDHTPRHTAALINLGNLYEDEGDRQKAEATYRQVLAHDSGNALALARLGGVMTITSPDDAIIRELQKALKQPSLSPLDRADLGFSLGRALDAVGLYQEAFGAYREANRQLTESYGPQRPRYDQAAFDKLIDRLMAQDLPTDQRGDQGEGLIFICGAYRSGSTLTEQIIGGHPDVVTGGELGLLPRAMKQASATPLNITSLDGATRQAIGQTYEDMAKSVFGSFQRLTDKKPDNVLLLGAIKAALPRAKVVITQRDRRDNALSLFFTALGPELPYAQSLSDTLHHLSALERLSQHWARTFPDDVFLFQYEDLIGDPDANVRTLMDHLRLDFHPACLEFFTRRNQVQTASVWQVRQPLYTSSVGRWKNYAEQFENVAAL